MTQFDDGGLLVTQLLIVPRKYWSGFSHGAIWFQLARVWSTISKLLILKT